MSKIRLDDQAMEVVVKMAEGNAGAATLVIKLLQDDPMNLVTVILALDTIGLYGSKLYMLWNDSCDRNLSKLKDVMEAWRVGEITEESIHKAVSGQWGEPIVLN